jgi:broad specificity phosphatase PhoE
MIPPVSTRSLLIRHAESIWNASGRWQGHADPPLSEKGVAQAEALGEQLSDEVADRLICSDLLRAHHTARIVGRTLGLSPQPDGRLRELDIGSWEGLTRAEIALRDAEALARFDSGDALEPAGGAESRNAMRIRVRTAFRHLAEVHADERIVVVTHLGVVQALLPGTELLNAGVARVTPADFADTPSGGR